MHLGGVSHESFLTLDVEDGGGRSGPPLLDPPQPPEHLHGLGGANGSTGEVEGDVGERGHVLRLLDEVRDTCRVQDQGEEHAGKSEHRQETVQVRSVTAHDAFRVLTFHRDPGSFRGEHQTVELHLTPVLTRILLLDRLHTGDQNTHIRTSTGPRLWNQRVSISRVPLTRNHILSQWTTMVHRDPTWSIMTLHQGGGASER